MSCRLIMVNSSLRGRVREYKITSSANFLVLPTKSCIDSHVPFPPFGYSVFPLTSPLSPLTSQRPLSLHHVDQRRQTLNSHLQTVAGLYPANAAGRAGQNNVARKQRHVG